MRDPVLRVDGQGASAVDGRVCWHASKSVWMMFHVAVSLVFAVQLVTPSAVLMFAVLTYVTLLLGHSVGMHRRLIHRSYDCVSLLDGALVYLGVLVGMTGPLSIIRVHDIRDWVQREKDCHDFFLTVGRCW